MKAKRLLSGMLALTMCASLAACGTQPASSGTGTDPASESQSAATSEQAASLTGDETIDEMIAAVDHDITIGICLYSYSNNWCSWQRNAILNWFDQCQNEHITYYMSDGQSDQARQNDAVDTMIARGIDVLICYVVQSTGASAVAQKCEAAGIPVVFLNTKVDDVSLSDYERTWFIGANNEDKANVQMDMIFDLLDNEETFADLDANEDGKINMFYIQGPPNEDMAICYQTVQDRIAQSEWSDTLILCEQMNSDNSTSDAQEITQTWIGRYGSDIELVLAHTDAQAAGAIEALRAADLLSADDGVYVLGSNCLPDAQVYIREGYQYCSILTDPWWQATTCLKMAIAAAMGNDQTYGDLLYGFDDDVQFSEQNPKIVYINLIGVTRDNLEIAEEAYALATRNE